MPEPREADMQATAEFQVVPIGAGVSVRPQIMRVMELLQRYDFLIETHASGTNIQGELEAILAAVREVHSALHAEGTVRLVSYLKLKTRTDKPPTLAGKRL
ncbi:MAG TPA: MTH1187 family thiamine-binding protein [Thiohalobacter sp.]|nr:MTH1187 family thiamine-binding protein [Thiohalobacter sp.]